MKHFNSTQYGHLSQIFWFNKQVFIYSWFSISKFLWFQHKFELYSSNGQQALHFVWGWVVGVNGNSP